MNLFGVFLVLRAHFRFRDDLDSDEKRCARSSNLAVLVEDPICATSIRLRQEMTRAFPLHLHPCGTHRDGDTPFFPVLIILLRKREGMIASLLIVTKEKMYYTRQR